ncbi:MAG: hemerythrin domain-containing protein [Streptosporangiaceae bacterium]|nr:hemerythrin domain-containing protein [Streptosporangiaceae bacterium]MBV9855936.1 hemerythrin domain-containing protein [Streptosporangiaceae bacterium]
MTDVFDVLRKDHEEVKQMLSQLESGPSKARGATDSQLEQRKKLAEQLVIEESRHEAVEQMYFWPTVRERLSGGDTLADQAIAQEQEGKEVLDKLDKLDASDGEFEKLLTEFIKAGREHIQFEETQVWPTLRTQLSAQDAAELGSKLETAKKTAPTRPHPKTPPSPGALKATGPVAGMADKARDAMSDRGKE